jgi:hypothetical protein
MDLRSLIAAAYGITPDRVMVPDPLLDGRLYDLAIKPRGRRGGERLKALAQQGIEQYFKLILYREERDGVDVIAARQDVGA